MARIKSQLHTDTPGLRRPNDAALRAGVLWFVGVFVALVALSGAAAALVPGAMPMAVTTAEQPPSAHYLAHGRAGHLDHHVLYHGLDGVSDDRLATADVLWLGNSRLLFALNRQELRGFFTPRGLTYFMLGFGHNETYHFPLAILERRKLRPRLVLVNVDEFFADQPSAWANRVTRESWFDAWKWRFENEAAHLVRRYLHDWLPHWPDVLSGRPEFIVYRSQLDGTWFLGSWRSETGPLPEAAVPKPPASAQLANARAFVERMRAQGTAVIFCLVPGPTTSRHTAQALAHAAGVPLLAPVLPDPQTVDGSHLSAESARLFARLLLDALEPHVDRLGL